MTRGRLIHTGFNQVLLALRSRYHGTKYTTRSLYSTSQIRTGQLRRTRYSTSVLNILVFPFKKIYFFFKNDPFARVSVVFGGGVLCLLLIVEALTPKEKRDKPPVAHFPPKSGHFTIQRSEELGQLVGRLPSWFSTKPSLVCVTGPQASGKTELVYQFAQKFSEFGARRFQRKHKQVLLYVDARDPVSLDYSLRWAARSVGVSHGDFYPKTELSQDGSDSDIPSNEAQLIHGFKTVFDNLAAKKTKWLLVIDDVNGSTVAMVEAVIREAAGQRKLRRGCVIAVCEDASVLSSTGQMSVVNLNRGLSPSESHRLLTSLSGITTADLTPQTDQQIHQLSGFLGHSPMAVALAALTIKLYGYFILSNNPSNTDSPMTQALGNYCDSMAEVVKQDSASQGDVTLSSVQMYIEAAQAVDWHLTHTLDFLGTCNGRYPIPTCLIRQHLCNPFYLLPDVAYDSPLIRDGANLVATSSASEEGTSSLRSYFSLLKRNLPFIGGKLSDPSEEIKSMTPSPDASPPGPLTSLKLSPFCRTLSLQGTGLELVCISSFLLELIPNHFIQSTLPRLEQAHLTMAEENFQRNAWFKRFRSFSPEQAISKYHSSLPGLSGGGVATEEQFKANQTSFESSVGYSNYGHYLHSLSHHHRVVSSMHKELKHLSRDAEDLLTRRFLLPHLALVLELDLLSHGDRQRCQVSWLAATDALSPEGCDRTCAKYQEILKDQEEMWGPSAHELVFTLAAMAEQKYYSGDFSSSKHLLMQCLDIQEQTPTYKRSSEQLMDIATAVLSLGLVQAALGEKVESKDSLEKALNLFQTIPAERDIPRKHRKLIASTVTDLGHAFLLLGDLNSAKRYLDLSVMAHRNIYPDGHTELARTLNVMSIVQALQGNTSESKTLRNEVGKIEAALTVHNSVL